MPTPHRQDKMERTSVTLPRELARRLGHEAGTTGRSASSVVRDALETYFTKKEPPPLPSFAAIGDSGHADTSERLEDLIGEWIDERYPPQSDS